MNNRFDAMEDKLNQVTELKSKVAAVEERLAVVENVQSKGDSTSCAECALRRRLTYSEPIGANL